MKETGSQGHPARNGRPWKKLGKKKNRGWRKGLQPFSLRKMILAGRGAFWWKRAPLEGLMPPKWRGQKELKL